MTDYRQYSSTDIISASLRELGFIAERFGNKPNEGGLPKVILIGGWAVDVYNPWFGSIDIDLVTSSHLRERIEFALLDERGFVKRKRDDDTTMVIKKVGMDREVIIDFMIKDKDESFEGTGHRMRYSLLEGRTELRTGREGVNIHVPKRAALAFLKTKAAWDRDQRVANGTSHDPEWERGKVEKDHADILALLDPNAGGRELSLGEYAELARPFPFLRGAIEQAREDRAAIARYGRLPDGEAKRAFDILLSSAFPERSAIR